MGYCHFFFFFSPWRVGALFVVFTPKNQLKECHFDGVHGSEFRLNSFCSWRSILRSPVDMENIPIYKDKFSINRPGLSVSKGFGILVPDDFSMKSSRIW